MILDDDLYRPKIGNFLETSEQDERAGFVIKVYSLLLSIICVIIAFTAISINSNAILDFMTSSVGTIILWTFGFLYIVSIFIGGCFWPLLKRASLKLTVLGILTISLAYLMAYIC